MEVANGCYCTGFLAGIPSNFNRNQHTQASIATGLRGLIRVSAFDDLWPGFEPWIFLIAALTSFACACADRHPSDRGTPLLISKPSKPQPSVPIRRDKPQFFRRQGTIDCAFGVGYRLRFSRGLAS
jgi:hypothetical protein